MLRSLGLVSLLVLAAPAMADDLSYNFLEFGYAQIDLDSVNVDGDGFAVGGSFEIGDSMFLAAGYGSADLDFDVGLDQYFVGLGLHAPLGDSVDLVGTLNYVSAEASAFGFSSNDDGLGASVGVRAMVSDVVELAGSVTYVDLSDSGADTSFGGSAWYYFTDTFALGLQADFGDDVTQYGIGARLFFGD